MDTSGIYRRDKDMDVECGMCDWTGWVTVIEDREDLTAWWHCPGCGQRHDEIITDDRGTVNVAHMLVLAVFVLFITGLACALFGALGHQFPLFIGGLILACVSFGVGILIPEGTDQ